MDMCILHLSVIIEDWNSDDEDDVSKVSPSKTNETQTAKTQVDKIGQTSKKAGIGFKKIKAYFVCKSTDHLIKDLWDNAKRVNHQEISNKLNYPQEIRTFVPSGVLTRTGLVNPVRPNEKRAVQTINTARHVSTARNPEIFLQDYAIVDFLKGTCLRYALTHNPTIYDSLVKQLWQTATVRTLANGTPELVASIDNKEYTITEASVKNAAEDQGEGSVIPAEPQHIPTDPVSSTSQPIIPSTNEPLPQPSLPRQLDKQDTEIPHSQGPTFTHVADKATRSKGWSHEAPLYEGHTSRSAKDSLQLKELMALIPKMVTRIANLEKELHQTKTTYGKAVLTLVERGRKIQDIDDDPLVSLVRESMKEKDIDFVTPTKICALGEVQEQDTSHITLEAAKPLSQSIKKDISTDLDADIKVNLGSEDFNTGNEDFNTGSLGVSIGSGPVSTPSVVQTINVIIPSPIKSQREGKAPMTTEEIQAAKRTKAQFQQEEVGLEEAMRLQALQEEEAARQVHLDALLTKRISEEEELSEQQKKRKAEPVIAKEEEFEKSVKKRGKTRKQKARKGIHIDKTAQDESEEEREAFMKDKVSSASSKSEIEIDAIPTATKPHSIVYWKIIPQSGLKVVYQIIRRDGSDKIYMSFGAILKDFSRDDLTELYRLVIKKYGVNRPKEIYDIVLWGDLKTMFDPPLSDDAIWSLPLLQKMINWRYYPSCVVHCLTLDDTTIYMLEDRKYPSSKDACQVMLKMKLLDGTMDEVCYQLLKMIEKQAGLRL
ncbi:hypothetical protein Tco_0805483 [Tanacetum coccineum]